MYGCFKNMNWYTKKLKLTTNWDEAHFVLVSGMFERINKPNENTIYNIAADLKKYGHDYVNKKYNLDL